jgi:hypothetical protein
MIVVPINATGSTSPSLFLNEDWRSHFVIAGAQKGGTTQLWEMLKTHYQVSACYESRACLPVWLSFALSDAQHNTTDINNNDNRLECRGIKKPIISIVIPQ